MTRSLRIRFVGGPWHNRIVDTHLRDVIRVVEPCDRNAFICTREFPSDIVHEYLLRRYTWQFWSDTEPRVFLQFVHSTLPREHVEQHADFPPLDAFTVHAFDQALRGCFYSIMGRHVDDSDKWPWPTCPRPLSHDY